MLEEQTTIEEFIQEEVEKVDLNEVDQKILTIDDFLDDIEGK